MSTNLVVLPFEYYADPTRAKPLAGGFIYVGEPNLDPELNPIDIFFVVDGCSGCTVPAPNPLTIGPGGVVLNNGFPAQIVANQNYSMRVTDKNNVQAYFVTNNAEGTVQAINPNLLQNEHFEYETPDPLITSPDLTPRNYNSGDQVFLNWFVGASGIQLLTYNPVTGVIDSASGSIYQDVLKAGPLGKYTGELVSSWGDTDGNPTIDSSISFSDEGDNYRVTLEPSAVFSCKLEQGDEASVHDVTTTKINEITSSELGCSESIASQDIIIVASGIYKKILINQKIAVSGTVFLSDTVEITALPGCGFFPIAATGAYDTIEVSSDETVINGITVATVDDTAGSSLAAIKVISNKTTIKNNKIVYGLTRVSNGLRFLNSSDNTVTRNTFTTAPDQSGQIFTMGGTDISFSDNCSRNKVAFNIVDSGNVYGINFTVTTVNPECRDNLIFGNTVRGSLAYGIILYRTAAAENGNFINNKVINNNVSNINGNITDEGLVFNFGSGIYLQMCLETIVTGNTITNVAAFTSGSTLPVAAISGTQNSCTITDNIIKTSNKSGIYLSSNQASGTFPDELTSKSIIKGNTIEDIADKGIWCAYGRRIIASENVIQECGSQAINITLNVSDWKPIVTLNDNIMDNCQIGASVTGAESLEACSNEITNTTLGFGLIVDSDVDSGFIKNNYIADSDNGMQINAPVWIGKNIGVNITNGLYNGAFGIVRVLDGSATPSVKNGELFTVAAGTDITDLSEGAIGDTVRIKATNIRTIVHGSGINLNGNSNFNMTGGDTLTLTKFRSADWDEDGRSDR